MTKNIKSREGFAMPRKTKESIQLPDWQELFNKIGQKNNRKVKSSEVEIKFHHHFPPPKNANPHEQYIVANVSGNSMKDIGIRDNDWVMWRVTPFAQRNDLIVVDTPYGPTLKFYDPRPDGTVCLLPANRKCKPQIWLSSEVKIRGVVVASGRDWL